MSELKATARAVGVLFIVASAAAILGGSLLLPVSESADLGELVGQEGQLVSGALIELVLVVSVVGIAVLMFPVLRRQSEGLALGYVGARVLEGVLLMLATMSALVVIAVSTLETEGSTRALADLALATRDWTYLVGSMVMFGVTAIILYSLLYRGHLVPAWLSLWGLAGGVLILARGVVEMYGADLSPVVQGLVAAPIGLNEMVLAVWLIVRGFDIPAASPEAAGFGRRDAIAAAGDASVR